MSGSAAAAAGVVLVVMSSSSSRVRVARRRSSLCSRQPSLEPFLRSVFSVLDRRVPLRPSARFCRSFVRMPLLAGSLIIISGPPCPSPRGPPRASPPAAFLWLGPGPVDFALRPLISSSRSARLGCLVHSRSVRLMLAGDLESFFRILFPGSGSPSRVAPCTLSRPFHVAIFLAPVLVLALWLALLAVPIRALSAPSRVLCPGDPFALGCPTALYYGLAASRRSGDPTGGPL